MKTKQLIVKLKGFESFKETVKAIQMVAASDLKELKDYVICYDKQTISVTLIFDAVIYDSTNFLGGSPKVRTYMNSSPIFYTRRNYPGRFKVPCYIKKLNLGQFNAEDMICSAKWGKPFSYAPRQRSIPGVS